NMSHPVQRNGGRRRRGAALIELVLMMPVLALVFCGSLDFARVYYVSLTLANCARDGALYAADSTYQSQSGYANVTEAALADAGTLSPSPTVTQTTGTETDGSTYVAVTVSYVFRLAGPSAVV